MNNLVPVDLDVLAFKINQAVDKGKVSYNNAIASIKNGLEADREIGELLLQAKTALPHGQFTQWVEVNCQFGMRQAQRRMWLATNWSRITEKLQEVVESKYVAGDAFENSRLINLKTVLALCIVKEKDEPPINEEKKSFRVASPDHECFGEVVEVVAEHSQGEVMVCRTSKGDFPFLKKELVDSGTPVEVLDVEVVESGNQVDIDLNKIREAIALIIEFLPEVELKAILSQSISLGKEYLPDDVATNSSKLLIGTSGNESFTLF